MTKKKLGLAETDLTMISYFSSFFLVKIFAYFFIFLKRICGGGGVSASAEYALF